MYTFYTIALYVGIATLAMLFCSYVAILYIYIIIYMYNMLCIMCSKLGHVL